MDICHPKDWISWDGGGSFETCAKEEAPGFLSQSRDEQTDPHGCRNSCCQCLWILFYDPAHEEGYVPHPFIALAPLHLSIPSHHRGKIGSPILGPSWERLHWELVSCLRSVIEIQGNFHRIDFLALVREMGEKRNAACASLMNSEVQDQEARDFAPLYLIHIYTHSGEVQGVRSRTTSGYPRGPGNWAVLVFSRVGNMLTHSGEGGRQGGMCMCHGRAPNGRNDPPELCSSYPTSTD